MQGKNIQIQKIMEQTDVQEAAAESSRILASMMDLGETMLAAGGEAGRVEDTISRMGEAYGFRKVDVFTITSCIFTTAEDENRVIRTQTRRVKRISTEKVRMCNELSRRICQDPPKPEELERMIEGLTTLWRQPWWAPLSVMSSIPERRRGSRTWRSISWTLSLRDF